VPLLGGLGVVGAVALCYLIFYLFADSDANGDWNRWFILTMGTGLGFAFIGLWDDLRGISPIVRVAGESVVAFCFLLPLITSQTSDLGSCISASILPVCLILSGANFVNLCDNSDFLAAGAALISALGVFCVLSVGSFPGGELVTGIERVGPLLLAGAICGFLIWNRPPARLYLGDAGSLAIGALLAIAFFSLVRHLSGPGEICAIFLLAGYIIFDPIYVIAMRLRRKTAPWHGGTDHPSHDLQRATGSLKKTLSLILLVHLYSVATAVAVLLTLLPSWSLVIVAIPWLGIYLAARRGAHL